MSLCDVFVAGDWCWRLGALVATVEVLDLATNVNDNNILETSRNQRFVTVAMNKLRQKQE